MEHEKRISPVRNLRGNNIAAKVQLDFCRHKLTMKSSIVIKKYPEGGKLLTGFTIIELIITIFVLSIAIIGVFGAFSIMVILTSNVSDRLAAAYLAQEGVEIIRNIRDTNWLNMDANPDLASWDDGLYACENGASCQVDYTTTGFDSNPVLPWHEDSYLKIDADNFFYSYGAGTKTKFRRKITIDTSLAPYIMKVIAEVFWDEKPNILNLAEEQGSIQVEDTLYNWYNYNF